MEESVAVASRWRGDSGSRRAMGVTLVLGLALATTSLAVGFCTDDYGFRAALRSGRRPSVDLFRFSGSSVEVNRRLIAVGVLPWWTAPDFKLHFLRPLTGLLFALDCSLFGEHAFAYHLHSLAWYLALLVAVALLYRRLLPAGCASLALLVFALRAAHVLPYAWVSARHVLVGSTLALFSLLAHIRAQRHGWRPGLVLAPLLFVCALTGSEAALAIVPFWVGHDVASRARPSRWTRVLATSGPVVALAAGYLVVYHLLGGGARSSGWYHDPVTNPLAFARVAATRLPTLLADALLGVPVEASFGRAPALFVALGLSGAGLCALLAWLRRTALRPQARTLAWLLGAALVALLVGVSGVPGGRVLVLPDLGFSALLGTLLRHGFGAGGKASVRVASVLITSVLVLAHLVIAPVASLGEIAGLVRVARATEAIAREVEMGPGAGQRVFLLAASDPFVFLYPKGILAEESPGRVDCWSVLSSAAAPHTLLRTGERSFMLEPVGAAMLEGFDTLFRAPSLPMKPGDAVRQCGALVTVEAAEEGKPTRLRVEFDGPLDGPRTTFVVWQDNALRRLPLPAVGATADLPWSPGPSHHSWKLR